MPTIRSTFHTVESGEELQIISVVNFKGGSGKTTTAAHLAQHLALSGHRVLAIDLDPQASLSSLHGVQPELDKNPSLYDAIRYDERKTSIVDVIKSTNFPGLDIVPANLELQEYEYETPLNTGHNSSARGEPSLLASLTLSEQVDDRYDVVVIDCPPQLGYLTLTALTASTAVLITIHPQMLDVMSMSQFLLMLGGILQSISGVARVNLKWFRYLVTRSNPRTGHRLEMVGFMQTLFPAQILNNRMVKSTAISDAGITNQTLYEVDRAQFTHLTYDRAMEALTKVNEEITELIHGAWGRR